MLNIVGDIDNMSIATSNVSTPEKCSEYAMKGESLRIVHVNIRSIKKNFDEFIAILSSTQIDFDIIIFTECWLKVAGPIPTLQGFSCYYSINNKLQNDGVAIYTRNNLDSVSYEPV